jgi:hypothetical protein
MNGVDVCLEFGCCRCGQPVIVNVRCSGPGLTTSEALATVGVPCPDCGFVNQLDFEPDGTVRSVAPRPWAPYPLPAPSAN